MLEENMEEETEQNLSTGYCAKIYVYPNGYSLGDPEALEEDESEPGELIESETDLLKHVLALLKDNPVEPSEAEGFNESETGTQDKMSEY